MESKSEIKRIKKDDPQIHLLGAKYRSEILQINENINNGFYVNIFKFFKSKYFEKILTSNFRISTEKICLNALNFTPNTSSTYQNLVMMFSICAALVW